MKCSWNDCGWCLNKHGATNTDHHRRCQGYARCEVRSEREGFVPATLSEPSDMFEVVEEPTMGVEEPTLGAVERKQRPVYSGLLKYFPDACMEVANCSFIANEQHNPGMPMHWNRAKSADEHDALVRHLMEAGTMDSDGIRHSTKVAWRAMALLQKEIEQTKESN